MLSASEFWATITYMSAVVACRKHRHDILIGRWQPVAAALAEIRDLHTEANASEVGFAAPIHVIVDALNEAAHDFGFPSDQNIIAPANDPWPYPQDPPRNGV